MIDAQELPFSVSEIERGILFVHMRVSSVSVKTLKILRAMLDTCGIDGVQLNIIDCESVRDDLLVGYNGGPGKLGVTYHGVGETFWIKDGRVIAHLAYSPDYYQKALQNTKALYAIQP